MLKNKPNIQKQPIDAIISPLVKFLHIESASGIVLLLTTIVALVVANSSAGESFHHFWEQIVGIQFGSFILKMSLHHWINDLLMAIFFFVVGLEVKREMIVGELNTWQKASLPIFGAIGGMLLPAAIYLFMQSGQPGVNGWGIPMATDIAFVVGIIAVIGKRIPNGLRVFLLSLAIADDIGAILVIAIGYTSNLDLISLIYAAAFIGVFLIFIKAGIRNSVVYIFVAFVVWYFIYKSGIHATIAGVIIGLLTPIKPNISENKLSEIVHNSLGYLKGEGWHSKSQRYGTLKEVEKAARISISPLERFETGLHPWVGFFIMPLFALANAGVVFKISDFSNNIALAVMAGLLLGKPIGITLFSLLAVKLGISKLPARVNWGAIIGGGFLAGIGFTMALFIGGLALDSSLLDVAKVGILGGSFLAAIIGSVILVITLPNRKD